MDHEATQHLVLSEQNEFSQSSKLKDKEYTTECVYFVKDSYS